MNTLNTGSTLKNGAYKIIRTLGQGSFGITYLASARTTIAGALGKMDVEVNIAIKEFFMSDLNSRSADGTSVEKTDSSLVKNYRTKFRREAENLSKLHNSNIVKVLDVFDENNTTYYVMEYVDGMNLDDYIKQQGRLTVSESLRITKEVCSALSYMHEHKMLHLDLKPKNIMRDKDGHIRLIDFGLSKQYNDNGEPESSTTIGLGTPGYAPTEQANYKQDGTLPVTIDVYALGGTLYKMLTGQTPPEASYILNEGLPEDVLSQAGVPEEVIAIVDKAMEPKRKLRYQSVEALSAAIVNPQSSGSAVSNLQDEQTIISPALPKKDEVAAKESETFLVTDPVSDNRSDVKKKEEPNEPNPQPIDSDKEKPASKYYWAFGIIGVVLLGVILYSWLPSFDSQQQNNKPHPSSSYMVSSSKYESKENQNKQKETSNDSQQQTGSLHVESQPSGASVFIDNRYKGATPLTVNNLTFGVHQIKLNKIGYKDWEQVVTVNDTYKTESVVLLKSNVQKTPEQKSEKQKVTAPTTSSRREPQPQVAKETVSSSPANNQASSATQPMPNVQTFTVNGNGKTVTFKMKKVEAGSFQMGSDSGNDDEKPVHRVTISEDYYMGETEVTQDLWVAVMGNNPSHFKGGDNPVEGVSYNDCLDFIRKLNQKTGKNFRMPTEAEWEYAARGGNKSRGFMYAGSNDIKDVAWYNKNSYEKGSNTSDTHPVAQKQANELGLYDMSGNVWEWCYDWHNSNYYSSSPQTDPKGPSSGSLRVCRGGSWDISAESCRLAYRSFNAPTFRFNYLGFRLAL